MPEQKKICLITTISGTMKSFVLDTAIHLQRECSYEITLVCSPDAEFQASLPPTIRFIPVPMARGVDLSALRSIWRFYQIFRREKFDLVQYSTPNASCYASIAAWLAQVPKRLYCQWGIRYVGLSGISRKLFKSIEKIVCSLSTDVRAVSKLNREFAMSEKLYPLLKSRVVGNGGTIGVDLHHFDFRQKGTYSIQVREKFHISQDSFVFGFVGRITKDKGCVELLSAFRELGEIKPHIKLLIVGSIERNCGLPEELLAWAQSTSSIVFTGRISKSDIPHYYAAMDVMVHPTYREGFGMVIQEAGAMGVPVITTRIPGASEVMVDGESCLLVAPRSKDELLSSMEKLASDLALTFKLGEGAYSRTCSLYDRPVMLGYQQKDYENLLENEDKKIILSTIPLDPQELPYSCRVQLISERTLVSYDGNEHVTAIVGSRSMSKLVACMNFPGLKLFQLTSAGYDGVPQEQYRSNHVDVCNAADIYSVPIAETVIYGMLQMAKRLRRNPNNRTPKFLRGYRHISELSGKKVLIIGMGSIGSAVAERLKGFGMLIDGYARSSRSNPLYQNVIVGKDELLEKLHDYDYIVSTLPENEHTKHFVDTDFLQVMNNNAVFINVGRRSTIDEKALWNALKTHQIGGAVLDMFERLPLTFMNPFYRLSNVIVLPGVAAISKEVRERLRNLVHSNVGAVLNGTSPSHIIN